jgi:hypothetical protein
MRRFCSIDLAVLVFLGALLACDRVLHTLRGPDWLKYPAMVSLAAVAIAALVLEVTVRFLGPRGFTLVRRIGVYVVGTIAGVVLCWSVSLGAPPEPRFRVVLLAVIGAPIFGGLGMHMRAHIRAGPEMGASIAFPVAAGLMLAAYVVAAVV